MRYREANACAGSRPRRQSMSHPGRLYSGRLWRHKRTLLGGDQWKECWIVLHDDGKIVVYNDNQCSKIVSRSVNITTVQADLRIGSEALNFHRTDRPAAPFGDATIDALFMTLPTVTITKSIGKPLWFYFKSERDMAGWLRAFAKFFGKEHLFDAILEELREQEERQLREELEATDTPAVKEQYEESSKHSGLSIRGEAYRQKRGDRNFGAIWARVVHGPSVTNEQAYAERLAPTATAYEAPFDEHSVGESPSTSDDTQPSDNGYHTLTTQEQEHSQNTVRPCEVTVKADVHSQHSNLPQAPTADDQSSSGRASDEDDPTSEKTEDRHNQPTVS